ncbi:MAG: SDR family oxidoreductase [Myxococcota bacterium]
MTENQQRIVVAGATGYLGSHVARALKAAGHYVRALVRDADRLGPAAHAFDEVFVGEATRPDTLTGLGDGMDAVFTSLGVRQLAREPTFWQVDRDANLALLSEAERAGATRFLYVSVFGAATHRSQVELFEAKEQVVDRLRESPLQATVIRPTGLFNDMEEFFRMALQRRVWLFGEGDAEVNPVHGADVAEEVVRLLAMEPLPAEFDVGGPEVLTMREIGQLAFDALDRPARFAALPLGLLRAASTVTAPFNRNLAALLGGFHYVNAEGAVAPAMGHRRLEASFAELAAARSAHRSEPALGMPR